ncbi:MAG: class I SAM-dependent methyltransferase, partial [Umezawaea sp.]
GAGTTLDAVRCRNCGGVDGELVLDLGDQPACEQFADPGDDGPDPTYPLRMWFCGRCELAQLAEDPGLVEAPVGVEPRAMRDQAARVVDRLFELGWLTGSVVEFGSPHGGSWLPLVLGRGLTVGTGQADVVLDTYGLLHEPQQDSALRERAAAVSPGGVLVLQLHSLATVLRHRQWGELRHGHHAYWSVPALREALSAHGLGVHRAWHYPMGGGTVVVVAKHHAEPDAETARVLADERAAGVADPAALRGLQAHADTDAIRLRTWLTARSREGRLVLGYGAASRSVPVLCHAKVDRGLLAAVGDASPGKQNRRIPGTDVPVIAPAELVAARPDHVLLFLPDLLDEVRQSMPEIEAAGGQWVSLPDVLGEGG